VRAQAAAGGSWVSPEAKNRGRHRTVLDKIHPSRLVAGFTGDASELFIQASGFSVKAAEAEAAPVNPLVKTH